MTQLEGSEKQNIDQTAAQSDISSGNNSNNIEEIPSASPKKRRRLPSQGSLMFRIVVGGYLLFIAQQTVKDLSNVSQVEYIAFSIMALFFCAFGLILLAGTVRALKRGEYLNGKADEPQPKSGEKPRTRIRFDEED